MNKLKTTALMLFLASGSAFASPIGILGLGSSGFVEATLTSLNWTPDPSAFPVPGPPWNADVNSATTLVFAGGPLVTTEGVLINGGQPFGSPPPAGAGVFNPFLQFELHPNLQYFLTGVSPGSSNTNCAAVVSTGQSCSINVAGSTSPVVLTLIGTETVVSIGMSGFATDGAGSSLWTGGFSSTIPNITPEQILLFFCPSGACTAADVTAGRTLDVRSVSGSFSASSVPEPGTVTLLISGLGLMVAGVVRRRRKL